jgi:hypothetical protein
LQLIFAKISFGGNVHHACPVAYATDNLNCKKFWSWGFVLPGTGLNKFE